MCAPVFCSVMLRRLSFYTITVCSASLCVSCVNAVGRGDAEYSNAVFEFSLCRIWAPLPPRRHHSLQADRPSGHVLQSGGICESPQHHQGPLHWVSQSGETNSRCLPVIRPTERYEFSVEPRLLHPPVCPPGRKRTRRWPTRSSFTSWSFSHSEVLCPWWWRVLKTGCGPTQSPRTRSPTPGCTGTTYKPLREPSARLGRASNARSGRADAGLMGGQQMQLVNV